MEPVFILLLCLITMYNPDNLTDIFEKTFVMYDYEYNNNKINIDNNCVFFSDYNNIYFYNDENIYTFESVNWSNNINIYNDILFWSYKKDNLSYIKLYNTISKEYKEFTTTINIYDLQVVDNFILFSGKDTNGSYKINFINMLDNKENVISDTQNTLVEFSYYNNDVYFFEPNEKNNLYKFNILNNKKEKISNKIENLSSIKMNLFVNNNGIYFTKISDISDYVYSNLYRLNFNEKEIELIETNIDDIQGNGNEFAYCYRKGFNGENDEIIELNTENLDKKVIINFPCLDNMSIQNNYLVFKNINLFDDKFDEIIIVNKTTGEIIKKVKLSLLNNL